MSDVEARLRLDRMAIEDGPQDPVGLARSIHRQLGQVLGPVPVRDIAYALDIVEIRTAVTTGFVGALVMPDDRSFGSIAVAAGLGAGRERFTIGHELAHFLCLWHHPTMPDGGFTCSRADVASGWGTPSDADRHRRQESEANRFAIELLAPEALLRRHLQGRPDLARVIAIAKQFELSREASVRRYVELKDEPTAVVFSKDGIVQYVHRHGSFPFVRSSRNDAMPVVPRPTDAGGLSDIEEADASDWISNRRSERLLVQTLHQAGGHAITLLSIDEDDA